MEETITLEQIIVRRSKIPGDWTVPKPDQAKPCQHRYCHVGLTNEFSIEVVPFTNGDVTTAEFIANAPTDIDFLISQLTTIQSGRDEALREVERLRQRIDDFEKGRAQWT